MAPGTATTTVELTVPRWLRSERQRASRNHSTSRAADRSQVGVPVRWFRQAQPTLGLRLLFGVRPWSRLTARFARCSTTCGYGEWSRLFARCSTTWLSPSPRWLRSERQRASRNHSTSRAGGPESGRRTVRWFRQAQPTLGCGYFSAYGPGLDYPLASLVSRRSLALAPQRKAARPPWGTGLCYSEPRAPAIVWRSVSRASYVGSSRARCGLGWCP